MDFIHIVNITIMIDINKIYQQIQFLYCDN